MFHSGAKISSPSLDGDGFSDTLEDAALRAFDQDTSRHRRLSCPPFDSFQP
jgi:hypothetical protein